MLDQKGKIEQKLLFIKLAFAFKMTSYFKRKN